MAFLNMIFEKNRHKAIKFSHIIDYYPQGTEGIVSTYDETKDEMIFVGGVDQRIDSNGNDHEFILIYNTQSERIKRFDCKINIWCRSKNNIDK